MLKNRRNLFRAKLANGDWIHGYLIGQDVIVGSVVEFNDEYFNTAYWYKVDPNTIEKCTGVQTKISRDIYVGDRVALSAEEPYLSDIISTDYDWEMKGTVIEWGGCFWVRVDDERKIDIPLFDIWENEIDIEVNGNIQDDPGLKGGERVN